MKIMAIDFGDARTGIAISDPLEMLTGFTTVIHAYTPEKAAAAVAQLVQEHRARGAGGGAAPEYGRKRRRAGGALPRLCRPAGRKNRPYAGHVGRAPYYGGRPPYPIR